MKQGRAEDAVTGWNCIYLLAIAAEMSLSYSCSLWARRYVKDLVILTSLEQASVLIADAHILD